MQLTNQDALAAIQPELVSGESVVWSAQPVGSVIFHKEDLYLIPFSLLWGGFAIFWEAGVSGFWGTPNRSGGVSQFMVLWGIPFVLIGQYLIWGRFLYVAWQKRRTFYAVTNRRVIAVQNGWKRRMSSAYIDSLPTLIKEGDSKGIGILRFTQAQPIWGARRGWGAWDVMSVGDVPTFMDIADVDSVYRLVSDLREKRKAGKADF